MNMMTSHDNLPLLPTLDYEEWSHTRTGLQDYAKLLSAYARAAAPPQKHWWHIGLAPCIDGLRTATLCAGERFFSLRLDILRRQIVIRIARHGDDILPLKNSGAQKRRGKIDAKLAAEGIVVDIDAARVEDRKTVLDPTVCQQYATATMIVAEVFGRLRAGLREETSPVLLWAHHFDMALLTLTGRKVPGKDPADAEQSDEQVNCGFSGGDELFPDPYFYITHYPHNGTLDSVALPDGARLQAQSQQGIFLPYADLAERTAGPRALLDLCRAAVAVVCDGPPPAA